MKYVDLGRSGLLISKLGLGTFHFGNRLSKQKSIAILNCATNQGITLIDTASVYSDGLSEEFIGDWLQENSCRRDSIVLTTKLYDNFRNTVEGSYLSAKFIRQSCEESLKRLKTDYIDIYQMHHIDRRTPWDEIWEAMDYLVSSGKVLYIGSSNFAAWNIANAQGVADKKNMFGLVSEQTIYNLCRREIEVEVIPCCKALGIGVIAHSPMGSGILCGALKNPHVGRLNGEAIKNAITLFEPQLEEYEMLCDIVHINPTSMSLAWVLCNQNIKAALVGPRNVKQLQNNISALDITLSSAVIQKLDQIWGEEREQAPEHYAFKGAMEVKKGNGWK